MIDNYSGFRLWPRRLNWGSVGGKWSKNFFLKNLFFGLDTGVLCDIVQLG